jgi:hypothetical protein
MSRDPAGEFAQILRRNGIDYIFVGGVAIRLHYPSNTLDFDVMILPRDFRAAVDRVDKDPAIASMDRAPATMPGGLVIVQGTLVRFELLDPGAYSGRRSGAEFYSYVRRYASETSPLGRVAHPSVVWYMRLVIERHELYFPKILRDLRAGVPLSTLSEVRRIASRFGVAELLAPRLGQLKEIARVAHLS